MGESFNWLQPRLGRFRKGISVLCRAWLLSHLYVKRPCRVDPIFTCDESLPVRGILCRNKFLHITPNLTKILVPWRLRWGPVRE